MGRAWILGLALVWVGCDASSRDARETRDERDTEKRKKGTASDTTSDTRRIAKPQPTQDTIIHVDPKTGKTQVEGAKARTGDPKDCAAFDACCSAPEASLFCGLAQANEGDCAKLLKDVKSFLAESKIKPPAGC